MALILSRLSSADGLLAVLPFILFSGQKLTLEWPPSPPLTCCLLPWFRLLYTRSWNYIRYYESLRSRQGLEGTFQWGSQQDLLQEVQRRDGVRFLVGALSFPGKFLAYVSTFSNFDFYKKNSPLLTIGHLAFLFFTTWTVFTNTFS